MFLLIILAIVIFNFATKDGAYWTRFKLYRLLLTSQLDEIRADYSKQDCRRFSDAEKQQGYFEAFVTGYCKPKAADFPTRNEFLCAVALNCSCPAGKQPEASCASSSLSWQGCSEFNEATIDYCHQTASEIRPETGHVAADWSCFPSESAVTIDDKDYLVADKGGIIKGRRFDIWFDDCAEALKATGIYKVKIPK